jgi:hypothetical protein
MFRGATSEAEDHQSRGIGMIHPASSKLNKRRARVRERGREGERGLFMGLLSRESLDLNRSLDLAIVLISWISIYMLRQHFISTFPLFQTHTYLDDSTTTS